MVHVLIYKEYKIRVAAHTLYIMYVYVTLLVFNQCLLAIAIILEQKCSTYTGNSGKYYLVSVSFSS